MKEGSDTAGASGFSDDVEKNSKKKRKVNLPNYMK